MTTSDRRASGFVALLLQATLTAIAIVVALAVDGWLDGRRSASVRADVRAQVHAELARNRAEVRMALEEDRTSEFALRSVLSTAERRAAAAPPVTLVHLSSAAWRVAQGDAALATAGRAWRIEVERLHELQGAYMEAERLAVRSIVRSWHPDATADDLRDALGHLSLLVTLAETLEDGYGRLLDADGAGDPADDVGNAVPADAARGAGGAG